MFFSSVEFPDIFNLTSLAPRFTPKEFCAESISHTPLPPRRGASTRYIGRQKIVVKSMIGIEIRQDFGQTALPAHRGNKIN
jgi:hypothetical protein